MSEPRLIVSDVVEIAADVARCWAVLVDFADYGAWNPLCRTITVDAQVGGRVAMVVDNPGSDLPITLDYRLAAFEPRRKLAWDACFPTMALSARRDQFLQSVGEGRSLYFTTDLYWGEGADTAYDANTRWVRDGFSAMARALKTRVER